jgi:tetratricopeptide (TPR) repeat protein
MRTSKGNTDQFVLTANRSALHSVQSLDFPKAWACLKAAENRLASKEAEHLPNRLQLLALTYNNFSCYFKRKMKLPAAMQFLSQALMLETASTEAPTAIAATHLNISAVYSEMGVHQKALEHAEFGLDLMVRFGENETEAANVVIAHYNVAAEMEHLGRRKECIETYSKGVEVALKRLGEDHPLTTKIKSALSIVLSKSKRLRTGRLSPGPMDDSYRLLTHSSSQWTKSTLSPAKPTFRSFVTRGQSPAYQPVLSTRRAVSRQGVRSALLKSPVPSVKDCLSTVRRIQSLLTTKTCQSRRSEFNL